MFTKRSNNMSVTKKQLTTKNLVLIGILLAAGTVIKAVFPKLPVTPNFIISMYALSIILVRPTFIQTLGIGLVSAILSQLVTAAPVPFINFASEPVGAIACFFMCMIPFGTGIMDKIARPAVITFITTFISGTIFVVILSLVLLSKGKEAKYLMIYTIVLPTAVANMVITTLCYAPLKGVLNIRN